MVSYLVATVALLSATASAASLHRQRQAALPCGANGTVSYTVVGGVDTLTTIATRFNSGICDIASANNIANPNFVTGGQVLTIPQNCVTPDNTSCLPPAPPATNATCVAGVGSTYNVRSGDTLTAIANDFGITLASLLAANPAITNPDLIQPAQLINVTVCPNSCCASIDTYTIVSGDVFVDLAATFGVSVGQIKSVNANVNATALAVGQQIILPKNCTSNASNGAAKA